MAGPSEAHAMILAGGRGTRFWPLSRRRRPKQLIELTPDGSLLAGTVDRLSGLIPPQRQWIVTSTDLADVVAATVPQIPTANILAEPAGRNTAPAVALTAATLQEHYGDVPFVVLPSDHLISPASRFQNTLSRALELAAADPLLLTFGVEPSRPETGYGYIETGPPLKGAGAARKVAAFTEKPDAATAQIYLEGGRHLWNSGMFAWRSSVLLDGLDSHFPQASSLMRKVAKSGDPGTRAFVAALEEAYGQVESISIDYALMEKSDNVAVLPCEFSWNDVGHWLAMRELWPADPKGNAALGRVIEVDSRECIVYGPERLTALVGVEDVVVVHTDDVTLVCAADRAQDVKLLLEQLGGEGDERYL